MSKRIFTPPAIISYAFVHEAQEGLSGKMEYSCRLVFDKEKQKDALKKLVNEARAVGKAKHGEQKFKLPLRDGDKELEDGDQDDPFYKGKVFFNCKGSRKPGIVGKDGLPLDDPEEELYSGCIVRVSVNPFAWTNDKGGRGVSFGLGNIKKLADGPRLDGTLSAEEEFEDDDSDDEIPFETVEVVHPSSSGGDDDDDLFN